MKIFRGTQLTSKPPSTFSFKSLVFNLRVFMIFYYCEHVIKIMHVLSVFYSPAAAAPMSQSQQSWTAAIKVYYIKMSQRTSLYMPSLKMEPWTCQQKQQTKSNLVRIVLSKYITNSTHDKVGRKICRHFFKNNLLNISTSFPTVI